MRFSRVRDPQPGDLATTAEGFTLRDMQPVPASPPTFGDAPAVEFGDWDAEQARRASGLPKPVMSKTPIWVALPAGIAAWAILAAAVYAAWTWL